MSRVVRDGGGGGGGGRSNRENIPEQVNQGQRGAGGGGGSPSGGGSGGGGRGQGHFTRRAAQQEQRERERAQPQPPPAPAPAPPPSSAAGGTRVENEAQTDPDKSINSRVDIPAILIDQNKKLSYVRGKLLGKGGFARCFEVTDPRRNTLLACKIVKKNLLVKQHQREKMAQEIKIHRDLRHEFIVSFLSYFEDEGHVFITMELCTKKSLMELQKRRRIITEPEAKYFVRQICLAVSYLHDERHIIHRDLKLGNIFISEDMCLKIGDFGLATTIEFDGERKKTLCGTPNYIAPEVLEKKGHSYQVDIWSIGCILYTLLVSRPPFETATLKETYHKIRRGEFNYPQAMGMSDSVKKLLAKCLQVKPELRPSAKEILSSEFMTQGFIPVSLPSSVLTTAPRFDRMRQNLSVVREQPSGEGEGQGQGRQSPGRAEATGNRRSSAIPIPSSPAQVLKKPLSESNPPVGAGAGGSRGTRTSSGGANPNPNPSRSRPSVQTQAQVPRNAQRNLNEEGAFGGGELNNIDILEHMKNLRDQIKRILDSNPPITEDDDENEDPSQSPLIWVCKWVDYSDKYGFGYHLSDESCAVSYNDGTKMILLPDGVSIHYIEKGGREGYHTLQSYPEELNKKVKLLTYFQQYMHDNLMKATGGRAAPSQEIIARVPNMWTWFRTSRSVVMVLSNGTLQINNFNDHTKMVLCPLLGAITRLLPDKAMRTYKLSGMEKGGTGVSEAMFKMLKYALEKVEVILGRVTGPGYSIHTKDKASGGSPTSSGSGGGSGSPSGLPREG